MQFIIIALLMSVGFIQSAALSIKHDPTWDLFDLTPTHKTILFRDCALLREMIRAHREIRVQIVREPVLYQRQHFQQQEIRAVTQPRRNKQKKQQTQYYNNKNNNRADRQKHAQFTMRIQQPQRRGRKK